MKLCQYHDDQLRTELQQHGVEPGDGPAAPIYEAQSLVIAKVLHAEPSVTGYMGCPICYLLTPSWLRQIAIHLARKAKS
jgi:hypothetical protein